ncbi:MAG TPA: hydroxylamine reductase [Anaerolineaceae bacterium]|jgi:hydroxylamine reductase
METNMFCYQCEQASLGTGCVKIGICGKDPSVATLQDLLIYQLEGMAYYAQAMIENGQDVAEEVHSFVISALFSTLTNVDFDAQRFIALLDQSAGAKVALKAQAPAGGKVPGAAALELPCGEQAIRACAGFISLRPHAQKNPDLQSLKDMLLYGLKGMAAYAYHAWVLGYRDPAVNQFFYKGLSAIIDERLGASDLLGLLMELGNVNFKCMELLDTANTTTFGHPEPTQALVTKKKGPFIIVSGHDLLDLKQLLEQTAGKGINIYTHGEMLPANAYPELKKYPHLVGNFGSAWQNQQREFDALPGCVLMTTNCLMEPRSSYSDRIYTSGLVGWPGLIQIDEADGVKDFSPIIAKALALGGWAADEPEKRILIGFGHDATLKAAGKVVEAVKAGQIKHFYLIGGCDGAKPGRDYYTRFAEQAPADSMILTLACGKYRFNDQEFGTVAGLPRLLDVGQCNDAYSAVRIAGALADAFGCGVNDLPLSLILSWYEQKAVCILLSLLALGIKNIYLGPTLPAFITPGVLNILVETFQLHPISTPEADLAATLG